MVVGIDRRCSQPLRWQFAPKLGRFKGRPSPAAILADTEP
jgi:hypothetical protein